MSHYTPGPWEFIEGDPENGDVYVKMDDSHDVYVANMEGSDYIDHANGRLITAAPDLLEALQKILNNWDNLHPKDRQQARAAIAKAQGS